MPLAGSGEENRPAKALAEEALAPLVCSSSDSGLFLSAAARMPLFTAQLEPLNPKSDI